MSCVFDIANQLLTAANTSLAFCANRSGWLMNDQGLQHSQSMVVCRNLRGLWVLKHWKIRIVYRQWCSNFLRWRRAKIRNENPKVTYLLALVKVVLVAENENDSWKICQRPLLAIYLKISSVGKDKVNNLEFCILKITPIFVFCSKSTHFFFLSLSADAVRFLFGDCRTFYFYLKMKSNFLSVKSYCVYITKPSARASRHFSRVLKNSQVLR